ncbi:hypothetical protein V6Z12_A02G115200 [Gossypium hirsutum]
MATGDCGETNRRDSDKYMSKTCKFREENKTTKGTSFELSQTCRRYWTEGGSLRNIPVGGGSRKNKRPSSSSSSLSLSSSSKNPKIHQPQDLNVAFKTTTQGYTSVPDPNTVYTSGLIPMQDFKPILNFSLDGLGSGHYGSLQGIQETTTGRLLFPFEDLKQIPNTTDTDQNKEQGDSAGYWTGMLGGGSW